MRLIIEISALLIVLVLSVICCTGCGKKDSGKDSQGSSQQEEEYTECETEDFVYRKYSDHIVLIKWTGIETRAVIPAEVDGLPVTELSSPELYAENAAFSGNLAVTSVIIPKGVRVINRYCFYNCSALRDAKIPSTVTQIGLEAFQGCKNLLNVELSPTLDTIPDGCFDECSSLISIVMPQNVKTIGTRAFHNCSSLESVILPETVENISEYAFSGCTSLSSITILAPECTIADRSDTISGSNGKPEIIGVSPSTAKDYADKYGKSFTDIGSVSSVGDVDGSGSIDSSDASLILSGYAAASVGGSFPYDEEAADANGDGNINAEDASLVLGYYAYRCVGGDLNILDYAENNIR